MGRRLPSLNSLKAYEAVGRHGSVVEAARALNVTAGAVSSQIKNLEADLGIKLLSRDGRGVRLTPVGEQLQIGLEAAFAEIAGCIERVADSRAGNRIRLYSSPMFASAWLIPRIDRFNYHGATIDVAIEDKWTCPDRIPPGADLIIDYGCFDKFPGFDVEKLSDEEIFPVCRPDVARHIAETRSLAECTLLHRKGIPPTANWPGWTGFAAFLGLDGIDTSRGLRLSTALIMEAARNGKGLLLTNTTVAYDDLASGRLVRPIAEAMRNGCGYWMLAPQTRSVRPEVVAFQAWLKDEMGRSSGGPAKPSSAQSPPARIMGGHASGVAANR